MTPDQLKAIRASYRLSCAGMAKFLGLTGRWDDRTIRRWEKGTHKIPEWVIDKLTTKGEIK